jgi:hypothetical protein
MAVISSPSLVPIMVAAPLMDDRVEVRLPNGVQVRLPAGFAGESLVAMLRALSTC